MEIEKLKESACARITAHFITGRNGQTWHQMKKKQHDLPCISAVSRTTHSFIKQSQSLDKDIVRTIVDLEKRVK